MLARRIIGGSIVDGDTVRVDANLDATALTFDVVDTEECPIAFDTLTTEAPAFNEM